MDNPRPNHCNGRGLSPFQRPAMIIVSWTTPNRISAPVAADTRVYANENGIAYRNKMPADVHEPEDIPRFPVNAVTSNSVSAPEANRIVEKLAGSMEPLRSATRHNTELPANATSARIV